MNKKILVYFRNMGPYHWTRMKALSRKASLHIFSVNYSEKNKLAYKISDSSHDLIAGRLSEPVYFEEKTLGERLGNLTPDLALLAGWSDPIALELMRWCCLRGVPAIVMSDTTEQDRPRSRFFERMKGILMNLYSGALVAGTRQEVYLRKLGYRGPIEKGYCVVDNDFFLKHSRSARRFKKKILKKLGLPKYYFCISARLVKEKSIYTAIEAFAIACRRGMDRRWCLAIAGEGPLRQKLEDFSRTFGLNGRIFFLGSMDYENMPAVYALAVTTILPSESEPWGLVVNESFACGTPVIVSNVCGAALDLVKHGINGFIFEPLDTSSLAGYILDISNNKDLAGRMGEKGLQLILNWGPERFVESVLTISKKKYEKSSSEFGCMKNFYLWILARRKNRIF